MLTRRTQLKAGRSERGFTLLEILVAVAVMAVLGLALVGLMSSAVTAWRRGEADREVHEKLQALRRQVADDLAAAVVDPPPTPDFHYALDTLWDLPTSNEDPYYIVTKGGEFQQDTSAGRDLAYYAPAAGATMEVVLRIRVPFPIGSALLKARLDCLDDGAWARLSVAREEPDSDPPVRAEWRTLKTLHEEGIGGAERDITAAVQGGEVVFIRAELDNDVADTAQFLRGDRLRSEGRPVLILDCYKDRDAVSQGARPSFVAYFRDGVQVVSWVRTIPGEMAKAALRQAGSGGGSEYLNHFDDDGDGEVDEPADLLPLGGRGRVVYRFEPYPAEVGKPGLGVIRRGFEAPLERPIEDIPTHDFVVNALHCSMAFWGGDTTVWETQPELDSDYGSLDPPPHPPSQRWLSCRYLPEQVQVTAVLEPERGEHYSAGLRADFGASETGALRVSSARGFSNSGEVTDFVHDFIRDPRHFVKIGSEWLYYERADERTDALIVPDEGRGLRGTTAAAHSRGDEVYRGRPFVFTVHVPAFRHWEP
jgi:prepilin-type N-terminal cleavage/methylation domain-containing protein